MANQIEKELQNTLDAIDWKLSQKDRITDLEYIQLHQMRAKLEEKLRAAKEEGLDARKRRTITTED